MKLSIVLEIIGVLFAYAGAAVTTLGLRAQQALIQNKGLFTDNTADLMKAGSIQAAGVGLLCFGGGLLLVDTVLMILKRRS